VYLADFLAENRGMGVELATVVLLFFGLGNFLGQLVSGFVASYLYARDKRLPSLFAGFSTLLGTVPFWILLNYVHSSSSIFFTYPIAILSGFSSAITGPIVKATLQNVTQPDGRGQAFALYNTFDDFGRGLGPIFVAIMVSHLGGRTPAFNAGTSGWIVCGVLNLGIFFFVKVDEDRNQMVLEERLGEATEEDGVAMQTIDPLLDNRAIP
jgi:predicted MFS family arabinose efflux permease